MENIAKLKESWKRAENTDFTGWDFSKLEDRWITEDLPWDYKEIVESKLKEDFLILDIDTGGGEFLLSLNHNPNLTYVTEEYKPNVELCRKRLTHLGIEVIETNGDLLLPFRDNHFDMIICKHGEFSFKEVYRVLKPGGYFITQQVGGLNNNGLSKRLNPSFVPPYIDHTLHNNLENLKKAGFNTLYSNEFFSRSKFLDIEALIYFAKVIEWEFPGFSVEKSFARLLEINSEIETTGFIESLEHRFIISAVK